MGGADLLPNIIMKRPIHSILASLLISCFLGPPGLGCVLPSPAIRLAPQRNQPHPFGWILEQVRRPFGRHSGRERLDEEP